MYSSIEIARGVADAFEREAGKPDPRDPRVRITRADRPPAVHGGGEPLRHRKHKH